MKIFLHNFQIVFLLLTMTLFSCYEKSFEKSCHQGNAKNNNGDYAGAILDYNKTIELNPDYADAYCNRGIAKGNLKDNNGACLDFNKALELGSERAKELINNHCK